MFRTLVSVIIVLSLGLGLAAPLVAQADPVEPAGQLGPSAPVAPAVAKPDALLIYRQARNLETMGRMAEATSLYSDSIAVCDAELASELTVDKRMNAYVVKCWSLLRLNRNQEVVDTGNAALKVVFDARIIEVMGEAYFFLGKNDLALKSFQRYLESGQYPDRVATAYFYLGETYLRMKKWSHADIAYTTAVKREPTLPRWWYRLGQVCENLGDWQRATDAYAKALSLSPGLKEASDGLARVKPKLGA